MVPEADIALGRRAATESDSALTSLERLLWRAVRLSTRGGGHIARGTPMPGRVRAANGMEISEVSVAVP
jgi:hypothetical protein